MDIMHFWTCIFSIFIFVTLVQCQKQKNNGEQIADELYKHPKECKDPNDGGIWAPLAPGHSCGPPGHDCNYPNEWCSARSSSHSVPQFNCLKLSDECKRALAKEESGSAKSAVTTSKPINTRQASTAKALSKKSSSTPKPQSTPAEPNTTIATTAGQPSIEPAEVHTTTQSEKTEPTTTEAPETEATTTVEEKSSEEEGAVVITKKPKPRVNQPAFGGAGALIRPPPAPAPPSVDDCKDGHPLCCYWASNVHPFGTECNRNAFWMRTTCQKSCGTCGCQASNFQSCRVNINIEGCPYFQGGASNPIAVPVNRGGGVFVFPTAGGNQGPLAIPVGNGFGGGFGGAGVPVGGAPSPVLVPLGNVNGAVQPQGFGNSPVIVRAGKRR